MKFSPENCGIREAVGKLHLTAWITFLVIMVGGGCNDPFNGFPKDPAASPVSVTAVQIDQHLLTLETGTSLQLDASIEPTDADNTDLEWSTNFPDIASVDSGLVTAIAEGAAIITVTTIDGRYTDSCNVTVVDDPGQIPSSEKTITSFTFPAAQNIDAGIVTDIVGVPIGWTFDLGLEPSIDATGLTATFETSGVTVSVDGVLQDSGVTPNDFSSTIGYTVTAEDGSTRTYHINATRIIEGEWIERTVPGDMSMAAWRSIASSQDGSHLAAVMNGGSIYISHDAGSTWSLATDAGWHVWKNITGTADLSTLVAVAADLDKVQMSTNSGASWEVLTNLPDGYYIGAAISADGGVLAITESDLIHISYNYGGSWSTYSPGSYHSFGEISMSYGGDLIAVADNGANSLLVSTDSGVSWKACGMPGLYLSDVSVSGSGNLIAVASKSSSYPGTEYILTSDDAGNTWTELTTAGEREWGSIACSSDGSLIVAGVSGIYGGTSVGKLYISSDGGQSWTEGGEGSDQMWLDLATSADGSLIAAATGWSQKYGYLWTSTDSGGNWVEHREVGVRPWVSAAVSNDGSMIAALADSGYLYTSTDRGLTWVEHTEVPEISFGLPFWDDVAVSGDGTTIVLVGWGVGFVSLDGGLSWSSTGYSGSSAALSLDGSGIWIVSNYRVYMSLDSGASWETASFPAAGMNIPSPSDIDASADGTKLLVGGNYDYIWTSTDSGVTWLQRTSEKFRYVSVAISGDGTTLGFISGSGFVQRSIDDGETWSELVSSGKRSWTDLSISSDGMIWVASAYDGLHISSDSGTTWKRWSSTESETWRFIDTSDDGTAMVAAPAGSLSIYIRP